MIAFAVIAHGLLGIAALLTTFVPSRRHSMIVVVGACGVAVGAASIIAVHSTPEWRGESVDAVRTVIAGVAAAAAWSIVIMEARPGDPVRCALCGVACSSLTWAAATDWAVPFALAVGVLCLATGLATRSVAGTNLARLALAAASLVVAGGVAAGALSAGEWSLRDAVRTWPWAPGGAALIALASGILAGAGWDRRSLLPMVPPTTGGAALALYAAADIPDGAVASSMLVGALVAAALVARPRYRVGAAASFVVAATLGFGAAARPAAGLAACAAIVGASAIASRRPEDVPSALGVALLPPAIAGAALIVAAGAAFDHVIGSAPMTEKLPWMATSMLLPVMTGASILVAGWIAAPAPGEGQAGSRRPPLGFWFVGLAIAAGLVPRWLLPGAPDPSFGGAGLVLVAIGAGASLARWMKKHRVLPAVAVPETVTPKLDVRAPIAPPTWLPAACDAAATVLFVATAAVVTWATVAGLRVGFL